MSCLDQGIDVYREHLVDLERAVTESELLGTVVTVCDFKAHIYIYTRCTYSQCGLVRVACAFGLVGHACATNEV